jgi:hypothetical protein
MLLTAPHFWPLPRGTSEFHADAELTFRTDPIHSQTHVNVEFSAERLVPAHELDRIGGKRILGESLREVSHCVVVEPGAAAARESASRRCFNAEFA